MRTVLTLLLAVCAACGQATVFFEEPFASGAIAPGWISDEGTTLAAVQAPEEGIASPESGPGIGKLTSLSSSFVADGSLSVGPPAGPMLPYTSDPYTVETRLYFPASAPETTSSVFLIFYHSYPSHVGGMSVELSPIQQITLWMSGVGGPNHHVAWNGGEHYAPLTSAAWYSVRLVLSESTAEVWLNGTFVGWTDWNYQPKSGGACGLGHRHQTTGAPVGSHSTYFDDFRITHSSSRAEEWQLFD